jgi:hypothetical protein
VKGGQDKDGREGRKRGGEVCWQFTLNGARLAVPPAGLVGRARKRIVVFIKINVLQ